MHLTVTQAARMAGMSKSQISRMISRGKLSVVARNTHGHPLVDSSDVLRCYPQASLDRLRATTADVAPATEGTDATAEIERLQGELERVRAALDRERQAREAERVQQAEERRRFMGLLEQAQTELPRLLLDQRTAQVQRTRPWWRRLLGGGEGG